MHGYWGQLFKRLENYLQFRDMSFNIFHKVTEVLVPNTFVLDCLIKDLLIFLEVTKGRLLLSIKKQDNPGFLLTWTAIGPKEQYLLIFFPSRTGSHWLSQTEILFFL